MAAIQYKECLIHSYLVRVGNKWTECLVTRIFIFMGHLSDTSFAEPGKYIARIANLPTAYESTNGPAEFSNCRTNLLLLTYMPTGLEMLLTIIPQA